MQPPTTRSRAGIAKRKRKQYMVKVHGTGENKGQINYPKSPSDPISGLGDLKNNLGDPKYTPAILKNSLIGLQ